MPDQATVNEYSEDMSLLQRELKELVGSQSVFGVSSRVRRSTAMKLVSSAVFGKRNMDWQYIIIGMKILNTYC
jgi:hypothetical protein